jgi:thioredoxin-related protein
MRNFIFLTLLLCFGVQPTVFAQNNEAGTTPAPAATVSNQIMLNHMITWMTFSDAAAEAEKTGKKMLVFVYSDYCGWCMKMQRETYPDSSVTNYLNQHYVLAKVNGDSQEKVQYKDMNFTESELASALKAPGFPFHVFMEAGKEKLQYLQGIPGYLPADRFRQILKFIGEDFYLSQDFNVFQQKETECRTAGKCAP